MDRQVFERVQNIRYLDALISSKNLVHDEIKSSIAASNRWFYTPGQKFCLQPWEQQLKLRYIKRC